MNIGAQSGLLAAIVSMAVAISVLMRGRRGLVSAMFTLFTANLFVHYTASFLHDLSGASSWLLVDLAAAGLLPTTSLLFFGYFLWHDQKEANRYLRGAYALSGLCLVLLATPWRNSQLFAGFVVGYAFIGLYICAWLMFSRYRELGSRREKTRLRYLLIFHLAAVSFVLLGLPPGPLGFLSTWGNLVSVFFLYFVSQSLLKHRLLDLQELLGRTLVLSAVALVLAVVFAVLVFWAGGAAKPPLFHTFVASTVILILFEPLRDQVEGTTSRLFFRERYELRRRLEEMRREVANILDLERMTKVMLDTPYEDLHFTHVSIFLLEEGGASYRLMSHLGPDPGDRIDVAAHRAFFEQLKKTPTAVLAESFERLTTDEGSPANAEPAPDAPRARSVLETLNTLHAGICIPLLGQNEVLGLWNLHDENGLETYSADEIGLLMAIGEQAAINIENSRLFERIRERDRLAVLGEMAAGMAHEIRNPLGAIKGAAQYLEPASVGEDAAEFLNIIIEEVDRLNTVVDQFLDYARPFRAKHEPTDINKVVDHTLRLLAPALGEKSITLDKSFSADLPPIEANEQQLTQVFLNLINNAIEAMPDNGTLTITTTLREPMPVPWHRDQRPGASVQVSLTDDGPGIASEEKNRIFVPFFTTKERGTGLGLAISQRIIENHGGEIRVRSKMGEGTTFLVNFNRLFQTDQGEQEPEQEADQHPEEPSEEAADTSSAQEDREESQ